MKFLFLALALTACSDGDWAKFGALGKTHHVHCYSGEATIYEGDSTGKITNEEHSDGFFFEDAATKSLVRVSGNCVITLK